MNTMITRIFVLFLVGSFSAASGGPNEIERAGLEDVVTQLIEQIREKLKCGIPEIGLPPLDPLDLEHKYFNFSINNTLQLHGSLNKVTGKNILSFNATRLKANLLPISFELGLHWEPIEVKGYYDIGGHLLSIIPIYGNGPFEGKFKDVFVYGKIDVGTKAGNLQVKKLEIDFGLSHIKVKIKNFLGSVLGDIISEAISENLPSWIEQFKAAYLPEIRNGLVKEINNFLKDKTMDELLDLIQGFLTTKPPQTTTPTFFDNLL